MAGDTTEQGVASSAGCHNVSPGRPLLGCDTHCPSTFCTGTGWPPLGSIAGSIVDFLLNCRGALTKEKARSSNHEYNRLLLEEGQQMYCPLSLCVTMTRANFGTCQSYFWLGMRGSPRGLLTCNPRQGQRESAMRTPHDVGKTVSIALDRAKRKRYINYIKAAMYNHSGRMY